MLPISRWMFVMNLHSNERARYCADFLGAKPEVKIDKFKSPSMRGFILNGKLILKIPFQ